jgi:Family of unknown function (DUF6191)
MYGREERRGNSLSATAVGPLSGDRPSVAAGAYRRGVGWGGMEEFAALFAPGIRHEQERRRHQELMREDEGDADLKDKVSQVDLDNGVAVLRLPPKEPPAPPDETGEDGADQTTRE